MRRQNRTIKPVTEPWKLVSFWKREKMVLFLVTLSGILYNVGMLAGPVYQGRMLDALILKEGRESVLQLVGTFILVIALVQAFRYMKRFYIRRFANDTSAAMRLMIYNNLIHKPESELEHEDQGSLMTKAISDVEACVEGMRKFTTEVFDTGVLLLSYLVLLLSYDWKVTLISFIFIPFAMMIAQNLKKVIYRYTSAYRKQVEQVSSFSYDCIEHALLYRIHGRDEENQKEYEKRLEELERKAIRANIWENAMQPVYNVIAMTGIILVITMLGSRVVNQTMTVGTFSAYISVFTAMAFKASKAAKLFNSVQKANVSWKRIRPYMETYKEDSMKTECSEETNQVEETDKLEHREDFLRVSGLSFGYMEGNEQLNNVNLLAKKGEIIGITGPVACGKSTFGRIFLGMMPYQGSIKVFGRELSKMGKVERSRQIAYMGHDPQLLSDTISENIALGDSGNVDFALSMVCFDQDMETMEEGIHTRVGNGGVRLSGGQQARIALARTLYHKSPLMILDDPFSAVDRQTEEMIWRNLRKEYKDSVILLISHRLSSFQYTDQVLMIHEDHTCETGTHEELISRSSLYRELEQLQSVKGGEANE